MHRSGPGLRDLDLPDADILLTDNNAPVAGSTTQPSIWVASFQLAPMLCSTLPSLWLIVICRTLPSLIAA